MPLYFIGGLECPASGSVYEEGEFITLECSVAISGHESMNPTLQWYRDGIAIEGEPGYVDP